MAKKGTLTVRVLADTKAAEQGLDRFATKTQTTGQKVEAAGRKMTVFASVPIAAAMGLAANAASNLNETLSKSNTVFGEAGKTVENWADTASDSFGQSKREALDAASSFGNLFVQLGVGADQAAGMSMEMTELASDFASFHNADITQVIEAQTAAFRGEYDSLQKFVPTMNAATVEQAAMAMTGKTVTAELTAQEKALAVQKLMLEGAGDAMGDFDRTSGSAANQLRTAKAAMEDASAEIGAALLPFVAKLAGGVADLAQKFGDLPKPVQDAVLALGGLVAVTGPILTAGAKIASTASSAADGIETLRIQAMYLKDGLGGGAGLAASLGAVGAVVAVGATLYQDYAKTKAEAKRITDLYVTALQSENDVLDKNVDLVGANELATKDYATAIRESGVGFDVLTEAVRNQGDEIETLDNYLAAYRDGLVSLDEMLGRAGLSGTAFGDALTVLEGAMSAGDFDDLVNDLDGLSDRYDTSVEKSANVTEATEDVGGAAEETAPKVKELADEEKGLEESIRGVTSAMRAQLDPIWAAQDAFAEHRKLQDELKWANLDLADSDADLAEAIKTNGRESDLAAAAWVRQLEAQRKVDELNGKVVRSASDVAVAAAELKARIDDGSVSIEKAEEQLRLWVEQGIITEEQAWKTAEELRGTAGAADQLDGRNIRMSVGVDLSQLYVGLQEAAAVVADFNTRHGTNIATYRGPGVQVETKRHSGGPVTAGNMYLVGRPNAEELFVPNESGRIVSGLKTDRILGRTGSGASTGGAPIVNINLNGGDHDASSLASHIAWALA